MTRRLIATYRLQLSAGFTLHDARERVPYLHALGISHVYCSPVLAATAGSTHGYDVADPTHVSDELGGEEALRSLAKALHERDMGLLLDIVPNHMGTGPDNPYWDDVLEHGQASQFAEWFDVAWRATTKRLAGKILVPILGDTLQHVIARDELTLEASERGVRVRYFEHHFPLNSNTLTPELELAMRDPSAREVVAEFTKGMEGRARLRKLLAKQNYELAFWRTAQRDLNYRRFFDVNELISLRVEQPEVFDATHKKVLELVRDGVVDGLRVDHIDGLLEPKQYLVRLRKAVNDNVALRPRAEGPAFFPIYVEKILAHGETLPEDWPVDGTTGYEFLVALEDAFIDPDGAEIIEQNYRGAKEQRGFNRISVKSKRRVLRGALNADVRRVAPMLAAVAKRAQWEACNVADYATAIVEYVAALPVYRTYIDSVTGVPSARDRVLIEQTLHHMRARTEVNACAVDALERTLLHDWSKSDTLLGIARIQLVLRLQQLSGPAAAKGVEDTALYAYAPLTSRAEVGGDPAVPVRGALDRLAARMSERAVRFPRSLNATNTHDTKRSADARSRLDALSEHAEEWERMLRGWRRAHQSHRTLVKGRLVPGNPADDFAYQSLIAVWPLTAGKLAGDEWLGELRDRLTAYLQKANREAKVSTSWSDPDAAYEAALAAFVNALMDKKRSAAFHEEVARFVARIAPQALWNTLGRLVVHLTSPGVPDIYQGDELWYAALVDPDNRRPVDWALREQVLASFRAKREAPTMGHSERSAQREVEESAPAGHSERSAKHEVEESVRVRRADFTEWRDTMDASRLKMLLTQLLLRMRQEVGADESSAFRMLAARGSSTGHVLAFERTLDRGVHMVVAVGRLTATAKGAVPEAWRDTTLPVRDGRYVQVLHGGQLTSSNGVVSLADAWPVLPVEVLLSTR